MSTNSECEFLEVEPGKWWYVLEDSDAPRHDEDWREYASAYGPFDTLGEAEEDLRENHQSPGRTMNYPFREGQEFPSPAMAKLMQEAVERDGHVTRSGSSLSFR